MLHRGKSARKKHLAIGLLLCLVAVAGVTGAVGSPASVDAMAQTVGTSTAGVSASGELTNTVFLPLVSRATPAPPPSIFGVQMYGTLDENHNALSLASSADVYWVRWPLAWNAVEPRDVSPDQYNWTSTDTNIRNLTNSGQRLIVTITNAPSWAATYTQGPVLASALPDFAEFLGELAERYDGDGYRDAPGSPVVRDFELFNEPDSTNREAAEAGYGSYYGPYGADYAAMLRTVYPAIKQASNGATRVVMGGLAYDSFTTEGGSFNQDFLPQVLAHGGGAYFDVMNYHYYPNAASRWYAYGNGVEGKAAYLRTILSQYGYGNKPMVVTEAGWHSNHYSDDFPGSPEIQARYLVQMFTQSAAARLETMIWWSWVDPQFPNGLNGLLTADLVPKPSLSVYRVAAERIGQAHFDHIVRTASEIEGYNFTASSGRRMYVFWTNDGTTHSITLQASQAQVVDMYGNTVSTVHDGNGDGQLSVSFGVNPVYVEVWP